MNSSSQTFSAWKKGKNKYGNQKQKIRHQTIYSICIQNVKAMTHLCFILNDTVLLLPHGDLGNLILPERSLFLQLWAPEGLDGVHGGTQLTLLNLHVTPQDLILTQHLRERKKNEQILYVANKT